MITRTSQYYAWSGPGVSSNSAFAPICGFALVEDHADVLRIANGFTTANNAFRLFQYRADGPVREVISWNAAPWVSEFKHLTKNLFFVAEDCFGDQYGYDLSDRAKPKLVKFWCEGGKVEALPIQCLSGWLERCVLTQVPQAYDAEFLQEAARAKLMPDATQHLGFRVPLVCGGEFELDNLEVVDGSTHLSLLGQLTVQGLDHEDGSSIAGFR